MSKLINTATGPISVDDLGVTLMHEHIIIGFPGWEADSLRPGPTRDAMMDECCDRIRAMQERGVKSMIDPCPNDLGRDIVFAAEVADKTNFNIICATGLYKEKGGGAEYWRVRSNYQSAVESMAELFIHELTVGVGDTGIKAGIIKVASDVGVITAYEREVLAAAAIACIETGAPVTTHTDEGTIGDEQQQILIDLGVDAHKIIIGHSCGTTDHTYHLDIVNQGSYLGFDRFGTPVFSDQERVQSLLALLLKNREEQIVIGHDSVFCFRGQPIPVSRALPATHFHDTIIPQLIKGGATELQIEKMLVDNPRRYFSGEPPKSAD